MANTRRQSAAQLMRNLEMDPLKYLITFFNTMADDNPAKPPLALELMPYAYPKLKAVDVELSGSTAINITIGSVSPVGGDKPDQEGDDGD